VTAAIEDKRELVVGDGAVQEGKAPQLVHRRDPECFPSGYGFLDPRNAM
jgi:hypothetical protein